MRTLMMLLTAAAGAMIPPLILMGTGDVEASRTVKIAAVTAWMLVATAALILMMVVNRREECQIREAQRRMQENRDHLDRQRGRHQSSRE